MNSAITKNLLLFFIQNIILRQLFGTCTSHIFTTYTGIQKSQLLFYWDKDGLKIENVRPTFFIYIVVALKFTFKFLSLLKSWKWRLAFSIESPLLITQIVAWVMFNWNWSTNRSAQQPSLLRVGFESVSSTTFGHKSCVRNTIDSCRLFLHRVSPHRYLYHRQNMDPRDERSEKSAWTCALLLKLQLGRPVDSLCLPLTIPKRSTWSCPWSERKPPFRAHLWMYFLMVDRLCVMLFLFSTFSLNITILQIGFIVVQ